MFAAEAFGSKCTVLKEVLVIVTLLRLSDVPAVIQLPQSDSATVELRFLPLVTPIPTATTYGSTRKNRAFV